MKTIYLSSLIIVVVIVATSYFSNVNSLNDLPLNKVQVIGSHNSYKQPIDKPLFDILKKADSSLVRHIDYSHISIAEQLSLGLLNLEIDIYTDTKGGKYAHPMGLTLQGKNAKAFDEQGIMQQPGFKVLHIQDIDFRSHCLMFRNCLQELKNWSDAHKDHYPVFITINAKDDSIGRPGFTVPEKFSKAIYDQLDSTIAADLGTQYLITPDMIRGQYTTLEEAVLKGNWPLLKNSKGKFIFILDESPAKIKMYVDGHPALRKRLLFVNASPGMPEAAILIMNEPVKDMERIKERVAKGYIIRTRADADTEEARRNDKSRFEAACRSGAQIITTDYYLKSTHFPSDYMIQFDNGKYIRANPLFK
jgi:hypothetical protein